MDIEIGRGKRARRAYTFDDIAVVPSRRTRNPSDVSTAWTIDAFSFDIPVLGAPMDSVVSPATAIEIGHLGGVGVLNLEGLKYIDSACLGELIQSHAALCRKGGRLKLVRTPEHLHELLRLAGLQGVFDSFDSEAEAARSFSARKH